MRHPLIMATRGVLVSIFHVYEDLSSNGLLAFKKRPFWILYFPHTSQDYTQAQIRLK
jgi:hypothetical protein